MSGLAVEWREGTRAWEGLLGAWNALVERDPEASVFQTPEWVTTWWRHFGAGTTAVMSEGTLLLAALWQSAWVLGNGESAVRSTAALTQTAAMKIVADPKFVPSVTIDAVGPLLS